MKKKLAFFLLVLLFAFPLAAYSNEIAAEVDDSSTPMDYAKGIVTEIVYEDFGQVLGAGMTQDEQLVKIKITSGPFKGEEFSTFNYTTGNPAYDTWVEEGDRVLLSLELNGETDFANGYILDYQKDIYILLLVGIFILLLLAIGKTKGLRAVITLTLTLLMIVLFFLPMLLKGYDPLFLAILTSVMITAMTLIIISGFSKKTASALLGTTGGLVSAALMAIIVGKLCKLRGLDSQEAQMLQFSTDIGFDFQSLLFAGIIIGSLGAVMDVTMSIASSTEEISRVGGASLTRKELFRSGMNVGQDIMGTMSNTLILAYAGTSIPMLLLFMSNNEPFLKLINLDFIATEIVRSVSGSIGLLLAIPITALISAWLQREQK